MSGFSAIFVVKYLFSERVIIACLAIMILLFHMMPLMRYWLKLISQILSWRHHSDSG